MLELPHKRVYNINKGIYTAGGKIMLDKLIHVAEYIVFVIAGALAMNIWIF